LNPIIEIRGLSYTYPDGKQALHEINLTIKTGEKVALVGANGAGKSTLLLSLNGVLQGEGAVFINGIEVKRENLRYIRAMVGIVFQNPDDQLFSPTVFEDVAYGPMYQGFSKVMVQERVKQALQAVRMEDYVNRNPHHLSHGEKKRIAIATVLSMQSQILALDEPTSELDPRARRELIALLLELPQTMIVATHDLDLARQLTTRTVLLSQGRIIADDITTNILNNEILLTDHELN